MPLLSSRLGSRRLVRALTVFALAWPPQTLHSQAASVFVVPLRGEVGLETTRLVTRTIAAAEQGEGMVIVLDVDLAGGEFAAAQLIIADMVATPVPIYALVRDAWQAGALLSLAADSIYMTPNASIGAGPPSRGVRDRQPVVQTAMRQVFRDLVASRGLDPTIGTAMVEATDGIPGLVEPGSLLTLGAGPAVRVKLAQAETIGIDSLLVRLDLDNHRIVAVGPAWIGTTVRIQNDNWSDVRISLVRAGARQRLGTVTTMREAEFQIPEGALTAGTTIQILAERIGSSERTLTERIRWQPGLVIHWAIATVLSHSSLTYYFRY